MVGMRFPFREALPTVGWFRSYYREMDVRAIELRLIVVELGWRRSAPLLQRPKSGWDDIQLRNFIIEQVLFFRKRVIKK